MKYKKGTTIMEVLIAIFVIGVGLLAVNSMFVLSNTIVGRSHRTNQAYLIANRTIEQLRALPFSSLNDEVVTQNITELPYGTITRDISPYNSDTNLKKIDIKVTWQDRSLQRRVEITSLATPRGINN